MDLPPWETSYLLILVGFVSGVSCWAFLTFSLDKIYSVYNDSFRKRYFKECRDNKKLKEALTHFGFDLSLLNEPGPLELRRQLKDTPMAAGEIHRNGKLPQPNSDFETYLDEDLYQFGFSATLVSRLNSIRIMTVGDLLQISPEMIIRQDGFGERSLGQIILTLNKYGLELAGDTKSRLALDAKNRAIAKRCQQISVEEHY